MFDYPVFLDISTCSCLVVGAGKVGCRKALGLLEAGAMEVVMIAPSMADQEEVKLSCFPAFKRLVRSFQATDLQDCFLVCAASSDKELNLEIAKLCAQKRILCNIASDLEHSNFIVPASFRKESVHVSVSTDGASPLFAGQIRDELKKHITKQHCLQLEVLTKLRPCILGLGLTSSQNKHIFTVLSQWQSGLSCKKDFITYLEHHLQADIREHTISAVDAYLKT